MQTKHIMIDIETLGLSNQEEIIKEMIKRGMKPNFTSEDLWQYHEKAGGNCESALWNDWIPTQEAMRINKARIEERLIEMKVKSHAI